MAREPSEPRVEDLLATIRRAIDRDISELDARENPSPPTRAVTSPQNAYAPPPLPPRLRGTVIESNRPDPARFRRNADEAIANLRQRVQLHRHEAPPSQAATLALPMPHGSLHPGPMEAILSGEEPHLDGNGYEHDAYNDPQGAYPEPGEPGYGQQQEAEALLSEESAYAAQASFQALSASFIEQMGGPAQIEAMTREMLRPMLKQWLDENLPGLVEDLVRAEIARVSRRR
jgi:cell pole-organizing protein PopZ